MCDIISWYTIEPIAVVTQKTLSVKVCFRVLYIIGGVSVGTKHDMKSIVRDGREAFRHAGHSWFK